MKRELFRPQLQGRVRIKIRTTGVLPKPGALRAIRSGNPRGIQFDPALNTSFWTTFRPAAGQSPPPWRISCLAPPASRRPTVILESTFLCLRKSIATRRTLHPASHQRAPPSCPGARSCSPLRLRDWNIHSPRAESRGAEQSLPPRFGSLHSACAEWL
jgi:hypothetical protein